MLEIYHGTQNVLMYTLFNTSSSTALIMSLDWGVVVSDEMGRITKEIVIYFETVGNIDLLWGIGTCVW
jgi:hypothetical protein